MMKAGPHEKRTRKYVARVPRRAGSLTSIRRRSTADPFRAAFHACTSRTRLQKEITRESEAKRTQAEGQSFGLGPRFPRHGLVNGFRFTSLANEFRIGPPFADDLTDSNIESLGVRHLPIVETKRLLINIAKEVEWLHADVGSVQAALQERPKVFHRISVDVAVHVLDRVIDDLVLKVIFQTIVGFQLIGEDRCARFDVLFEIRLQSFLLAVIQDYCANVAATLQHSHDNGFILATRTGDDAGLFVFVHIPRLAADERFIHFYFTGQFAALLALLCESDPVKHEPCGLLGHAERSCDLATADTVLAIQDEPHCGKPLFQTERGILENGSNLHGELPLGVTGAALPAELLFEEADFGATTDWANNTDFPPGAAGNEVAQAVLLIREVDNCFLKSLGIVSGFHSSSLPQSRVLVKYICT